MQAFVLVLTLFVALIGQATSSTDYYTTNITITMSSTIIAFAPETTVYKYGTVSRNATASPLKTYANSSIIAVTSLSVFAYINSDTAAYAVANASTATTDGSAATSFFRTTSRPVEMLAILSQAAVMSTKTQMEQVTVTKPATITCTIGLDCGDGISFTGNISGTSSSFELMSSTRTRTVTVQSTRSTYFSAGVTPLTLGPAATPVSQPVSATKIVLHSDTSTDTSTSDTSTTFAKTRLSNSTSVASASTISSTLTNSTSWTSPLLSSRSSNPATITSTIVTTLPSTQPPQTQVFPSTTVVSIVPITTTTTASPATLNTTAAGKKIQPPCIFGLIAGLAGNARRASESTLSEVIVTTYLTPTTYITTTPTGCAFHSEKQECMPNLGFNL